MYCYVARYNICHRIQPDLHTPFRLNIRYIIGELLQDQKDGLEHRLRHSCIYPRNLLVNIYRASSETNLPSLYSLITSSVYLARLMCKIQRSPQYQK
mgnify:CR=1 FL=1